MELPDSKAEIKNILRIIKIKIKLKNIYVQKDLK